MNMNLAILSSLIVAFSDASYFRSNDPPNIESNEQQPQRELLKDVLGLLPGDVCGNKIRKNEYELEVCDESRFPKCDAGDCSCDNDDDDMVDCDRSWKKECGLCMRREVLPGEEKKRGNDAEYFIDYNRVQCVPEKWDCNMCFQGVWCREAGRCIIDPNNFMTNRFRCEKCGWNKYCDRKFEPTASPTEEKSERPSLRPTIPLTSDPTDAPSDSPTQTPTETQSPSLTLTTDPTPVPSITTIPTTRVITMEPSQLLTSTVFYVTAEYPKEDKVQAFQTDLERIPDTTPFVIHLGDFNNDEDCNVESYQEFAATLVQYSDVPVFVVPGNDEWNDCPDPVLALNNWRTNLATIDVNWVHPLNVRRQNKMKNFAFLHASTLFIGLSIVNGNEPPGYRFVMDRNINWVRNNVNLYNGRFKALAVFGNNDDDSIDRNRDFFVFLGKLVNELQVPTLYMYESGSPLKGVTGRYDAPNLTMVRVKGRDSDFVRVEVDVLSEKTFYFAIDR